jgi:biopolymer transport protein ExbD
MLSLRRPDHEARVEIMPLIDVIFLLLTFFIYAMVLMVRAELLPIELQAFASGTPARPASAATISILRDGTIHFNREPITLDDVRGRIDTARTEDPETVLYLALEDGEGSVDRGPLLTALWDRLQGAGLEIHFVGRPAPKPGGAS